MPHAKRQNVQTTVRIPKLLYQQAKDVVDGPDSPIQSFNDLMVAAVTAYLRMLERRRIDAAFRVMAKDANYQKEALLVAEQFAHSDWEALEAAEKDHVGA